MRDLYQAIPNADVVLALPVEELAGKLLWLSKARIAREGGQGMFIPDSWAREWPGHSQEAYYPRERWEQVAFAVSEAFTWLRGQALIIPAAGQNGTNGWVLLSRRAAAMTEPEDFDRYRSAQRLPRELLHPSIADQVWLSFARGEYDTAAFQAMRQVEIALRAATHGPAEDGAVKVARTAFNPDDGPLRDPDVEKGERQGMSDLFAGALGALKNPHSHRLVNLRDPADAVAILLFASQLLRIIDRRLADG